MLDWPRSEQYQLSLALLLLTLISERQLFFALVMRTSRTFDPELLLGTDTSVLVSLNQ